MPKPNYQFEKRQRELAKKQKKEDKAQRKAAPPAAPAGAEGSADAENDKAGRRLNPPGGARAAVML